MTTNCRWISSEPKHLMQSMSRWSIAIAAAGNHKLHTFEAGLIILDMRMGGIRDKQVHSQSSVLITLVVLKEQKAI